jgi:cell volume regulation protein A
MHGQSVFFLIGSIILIGFLGNLIFRKTKISDILLLLSVGFLLGPVFNIFSADRLASFAEYFGSFALVIILFEGGLDLSIERVVKGFGSSLLLVVFSFFLSVLLIAGFLFLVFHWNFVNSLLLGAILGCTSAAIVIPVVSRMSITNDIKTILSIESALSDVLAVVGTISIIEFVTLKHIGISTPFRSVASSFSIAIVLGSLAGFLWLKVLDIIGSQKYSYMITLAVILIVYSVIEFCGGSGFISVLIFGIILGNSNEFVKFMKFKNNIPVDDTIKFFHGEVSFFIRTFFFVYLGMIVSFKYLTVHFLYLSIILVFLIVIARYLSSLFFTLVNPDKKGFKNALFGMLPRGLASAVLALAPTAANIKGTEDFVGYSFLVIVMTNAIMTGAVFFSETASAKPARKRG